MSDRPSPPEPPPEETPSGDAPRPERGGSVWLGILTGVGFFAVLTGTNILLSGPTHGYSAISWLALPLAYLVAAAFIAARPATTRFGSGLFIAVGVTVLLAAGICTALLSTGRLIA